nr:MAG TPA: hypothetical protein [Caudoviricetes sp.]
MARYLIFLCCFSDYISFTLTLHFIRSYNAVMRVKADALS